MFRRPASLHLPFVMVAFLPLFATACGDELADGDFGGVDLKPFFGDTSAKVKDPPSKLSTAGHNGFLDGEQVTYMDFGWSASVKDTPDEERRTLLNLGPTDKIPKVAPVNPMYFFFDSKGNPMFSPPVRETKTGNFLMTGGKAVRDPNPAEGPIKKDLAYPVRSRDFLKDPLRGVSDYQRPIIDVIFDRDKEEALQRYSGLWEFVKVIAPEGYEPDEIKSWRTLEKGVTDGSFKVVNSRLDDGAAQTELLAINCPLVDFRTLVRPNVSAYRTDEPRIPQPRVELWYRRKRVDCFLVNGWETLGRTTASPADGNDKYTLYKSSEDKLRVGVLDTDIAVFGTGTGEKRQMVSPLGQLYIPRLSARDEAFYVGDSYLTTGALPRRTKDDPPGYRPVRWWWNIDVSDFGKVFIPDSFKEAGMWDVRRIDNAKLSPRESITLNFPLTSQRLTCSGAVEGKDPCTSLGLVCGGLQDGRFDCETPKVRYGEMCAPTIGKCRDVIHKTTATQKGDEIEEWFVNGAKLTGAAQEAFNERVPEPWRTARETLRIAGRAIVERAASDSPIYSCLAQPTTEIGHCYWSCDGGKSNRLQNTFEEKSVQVGNKAVTVKLPLDSRCGGTFMPGFRCLPVIDEPNDTGGQWCLRDCGSADSIELANATCAIATPAYFSDAQAGIDIAQHTTCSSFDIPDPTDSTKVLRTFKACERNPAFAPFPKN